MRVASHFPFPVVTGLTARTGGGILVGGASSDELGGVRASLVAVTRGGRLDRGFGAGGRAAVGASSSIAGLARTHGRFLVLMQRVDGTSLVRAYDAAGAIDRSYGAAGDAVLSGRAGGGVRNHGLAAGRGGGAVALLRSAPGMLALARLDPRGRLVSGFGAGGIAQTTLTTAAVDATPVVDRAGRTIIAFRNAASRLVVARFTTAGSPDPTFGQGGQVVISPRGQLASACCLVQRPDGRLLAGGPAETAVAFHSFLTQLMGSGRRDSSFGTASTLRLSRLGGEIVLAVALASDGDIVVAGAGPIVCRYTPTGRADRSFGRRGCVRPTLPGKATFAPEAVVAGPRRVYVAGTLRSASQRVAVFALRSR